MISISKFVINRNNIEFLYTEKIQFIDGIRFLVYEDKEPTEYYPDTFYDTYGTDPKLSVHRTISLIESDLVTHNIESDNMASLLELISSLKNRIGTKNYRNPSLGQDKISVLESIILYNKLLDQKHSYEEEHDYLNDLEILTKHFGMTNNYSIENTIKEEQTSYRNNIDFFNIKDARVRSIDSKQEIA